VEEDCGGPSGVGSRLGLEGVDGHDDDGFLSSGEARGGLHPVRVAYSIAKLGVPCSDTTNSIHSKLEGRVTQILKKLYSVCLDPWDRIYSLELN
jgi:hypothetical protein